jgi:large subunit ribosomal protein L29
MKAKDIRELTTPEIRARVQDEMEALTKMRFNHAISIIENPSKIRMAKRNISRMLTILEERESANASQV